MDIQLILKQFNQVNFYRLWPGFKPYPFILYSENTIYLVNHNHPPKDFESHLGYFKGLNTYQFQGNTVILFEGCYTAILNLDYFKDEADLLPSILHETFHCFQIALNEKRFPNELLRFDYPSDEVFFTYLLEERKVLYRALDDKSHQIEQIKNFISLREARRELLGDLIQYELAIESIEGTAVYVEYKSNPNQDKDKYFSFTSTSLIIDHFRESTLYTGLAICLLLEDLNPNWKIAYQNSSLFLYDYLLSLVKMKPRLNHLLVSDEGRQLYDNLQIQNNMRLKTFNDQLGYKITLLGNFSLAQFDPMNMLVLDSYILNQKPFSFILHENRYTLLNTSLIKKEPHQLVINEIIFFTEIKPEIEGNDITISGLGQVKGDVKIENSHYIIKNVDKI